ncbi:hypothetical protein KHU50_002365 [Colletotrichum sp. SAR 10_65]|nr:hypothetical protein KHU50_002365 [Colletotrichum sp. SAR 10_65]
MADPLSIAASIAGLVGLADIVFARLVKFGRSVKNAEKEIQVLSREINILGGALNSLDRLAQVLKDDAFDGNLRIQNIDDCRETLKEINRKLEKLEATSSLTKQKLMWPFTKDRVKEWLDELSQHKENINLALSANSLDAMLRILSQEDHHAMEILAEIKETRKITNRIHQDSERRKVLDFFLKYNPQKNYDMSIRLRQSGTGIWLQKLQDFQHWLSEPGSKLWLKGIPGAGKTCLFDISEDADNVSIALLSRDEDEIRSRLEGSFTPVEIAAHKEDITEYVMAEIEERIRSRRLRISSLHLKGEILQGLIDGAGGM